MDSARLNCNRSHQVQLGVKVIYRINKKGLSQQVQISPFPPEKIRN